MTTQKDKKEELIKKDIKAILYTNRITIRETLVFIAYVAFVFIFGVLAIAVAWHIFIAPHPLSTTQYIPANLFPLYGYNFLNGSSYILYPQIQQNGTACIQYMTSSYPIFNRTIQSMVIIIYNATQTKNIYRTLIIKSLNTGNVIETQAGKTLLCPHFGYIP
ncbi:MAG: hypothetical protein QW719_02855 [Candidatus Micrarchaeaceae archaeon]